MDGVDGLDSSHILPVEGVGKHVLFGAAVQCNGCRNGPLGWRSVQKQQNASDANLHGECGDGHRGNPTDAHTCACIQTWRCYVSTSGN